MKSTTLLFISLSVSFFTSYLQAQPPCGFDQIHNQLLKQDPVYAKQVESNEQAMRRYIDSHPELLRPANRTSALYTIPVVVHVMHTGGAVGTIYNPTDAQIIGAINYLNQVYAGTYPGMTAPSAGGAAGNIDIQFAFAQRTPSCGATNGIDRVDASSLTNYTTYGVNASSSSGVSDLTLKNFARWNPSDYYNIWVVNKIDGADGTSGQFIAGYAYFAGASASYDGTVMLATQMVAGQKTLPHEIGHALNLYHPFQGSANSSQCPPYTASPSCFSDGDMICDTDPISNNNVGGVYDFSCRSGNNTCTSGPVKPYSINTESNFMSYTNCYTLFTNDQKTRMQAAMSLPSRASLVAGSNMSLIPCGTAINFAQASSTQLEDNTGTTNGCRTYKDYTYQMNIGAAPTATAIATLSYSGTAIKGLDYDVTTNGNFSSPSDVLTFNNGSTSSQNFTVRIFDDANVETPETIILDFTLNNGGGNGSKGTTTPTLTITLSDNDAEPVGTSSGTYSIGTHSYNINAAPFDAKLQSQRSQYIYKASELSAAEISAGNITSLQLYISSKLSSRPFTNFSLKMGHTNTSYLVDGSVNVVGGMTTVYSTSSLSTISGWNTFTLGTPFAWNGISNLAIEICYDNTTSDAGNSADYIGAYSDGGISSQGNMILQNNINCSGSFSSISYYGNGIKPIIKLGISITGIAIENLAGSTASNHITNASNDYFYSNNNKLMFKLNNLDAVLGCVNSSLEAGGTTWVNAMGGQRSAKVFAVTPTSNTTTTNYTISLYFENAELGGKNPSTLKIAKTSAASVVSANATNTLLATPTVTALGSGATIFTASFTGFSRFFLVDAGVVLPVTITDFTANANRDKNTVVKWITSFEQNIENYIVEVSNDGLNFVQLATVAPKGNSNSIQNYEYLHRNPAKGITWYRLKQTDLDGKFKYSKSVAVNINKEQSKAFIYPVPANDLLTINFGNVISQCKIEIFTSDMKVIHSEAVNNLSIKKEINIRNLRAGIYFMKLSSSTGNDLLRFIKE